MPPIFFEELLVDHEKNGCEEDSSTFKHHQSMFIECLKFSYQIKCVKLLVFSIFLVTMVNVKFTILKTSFVKPTKRIESILVETKIDL